MDFGVGAYLLPAALVFGAPASPGTYEKGLFCESVELVERIVGLAERGANPLRVVTDINARLGHTACIYATKADVRARTVRFGIEPPRALRRSIMYWYSIESSAGRK